MCRRVLPLLVSVLLCALASAGVAQDLRPLQNLPELSACRSTAHPQLPPHWRATYLLAPFTTGQLVLSEIVHDASFPATRITFNGVKRGTADFLIAGNSTYELASNHAAVTGCRNLGDTGWRPLPRDWLTQGSRCAGSAPVLGTPVDWWKTPVDPEPSTYWIWYKTADGTPFRTIFETPSARLPPLGRYALSYQIGFAPTQRAGLGEIVALCRRAPPPPSAAGGDAALAERLSAMGRSAERADAALARLMPALKPECPALAALRWPQRLALTGLLTPFDASEEPAPTEVLYDWSVPGQLTRIFPPPPAGISAQDALLLAEGGYTVTHRRQGAPSCTPGLPGTLRPDWPRRAPCTCEGLIEAGTPLTPGEAMRILACPLAPPRIAWAWYGMSGRPRMFMVTSRRQDVGVGDFAALDYFGWNPHRELPRSAFMKSAQCAAPPTGTEARAPHPCSMCHAARSAPERSNAAR